MAHWDEERDKRWVEMLRKLQISCPELKPATDEFERTGDLIHFSAAINVIRAIRNQEEIERRRRN